MLWLKCGHSCCVAQECMISYCGCCREDKCVSSLTHNINYCDFGEIYDSSYPYCEEYTVKFICGHTDNKVNRKSVVQAGWCFTCGIYKEKEMEWNGKKFWMVVQAGSKTSFFTYLFSTKEEAETAAEQQAAGGTNTFFVLEAVEGFKPKSQTERVKFRK